MQTNTKQSPTHAKQSLSLSSTVVSKLATSYVSSKDSRTTMCSGCHKKG